MMKCKLLWVLLVVIALLLSCAAAAQKNILNLNYFKLASVWPKSFCLTSGATTLGCENPSYAPLPQNFTIKALWKEKLVHGNPHQSTNCSTSADLTADIVYLYIDKLRKFWPDLTTYNQGKITMYNDLWKKFGSCCYDEPATYLVMTLGFREAYDLYQILRSSGIVANGRSYPANKILNVIRKATGNSVDIVCEADEVGNVFLTEIHQCIEGQNYGQKFKACQNVAHNCDKDPIFPDPNYVNPSSSPS